MPVLLVAKWLSTDAGKSVDVRECVCAVCMPYGCCLPCRAYGGAIARWLLFCSWLVGWLARTDWPRRSVFYWWLESLSVQCSDPCARARPYARSNYNAVSYAL